MASKKNYQTFEKNGESSRNSGSSSEPEPEGKNDNRRLGESCPAVLEPSKDDSHGLKHALTGLFTRSCPQPSTECSDGKLKTALTGLFARSPSISSSGQSNSHEDEQHYQSSEELQGLREHRRNEQTEESLINCCATFMETYKSYAYKIGISWFVFLFQLLIGLISISVIVMGIIFFTSCVGRFSSAQPMVGIFLGIASLVLVYMWFVAVCRLRRGDRFWNKDRNNIILIFTGVMFLMAIEILFFSQVSPKLLQEEPNIKVKCPKTYYDYLLYRHIVDAGCLLLAALLYLPNCCVYAYYYRRPEPSQANGHVEPI